MKIQTVKSNKKYNIRTYGVRELLRRGNLNNGGIAGPSYVNGNNGLWNAWWNILATISVYKKYLILDLISRLKKPILGNTRNT